jgi:hypothetical protein
MLLVCHDQPNLGWGKSRRKNMTAFLSDDDGKTWPHKLMIGRGVIRSPWLFNQIRERLKGEPLTFPTGRNVLDYVTALWESQASFDAPERAQCERIKKFMNYIGEGVDAQFLHKIRRTETAAEFFRICREFLDHDQPMALTPPENTTAKGFAA